MIFPASFHNTKNIRRDLGVMVSIDQTASDPARPIELVREWILREEARNIQVRSSFKFRPPLKFLL